MMDAQRITLLLERYLDESITAQEQAELEQMLLASPKARALFWEQAGFHALLRQHGEESCGPRMLEALDEARPSPLRGTLSHWRLPGWMPMAAGLVATALVAGVAFWAGSKRFQSDATTSGIAVLSSAVDLQWADPGESRGPGASLEPGWLRLKSGLAQIEFLSGARVILKGPAELQLVSPMEAFCRSGTLSADILPTAHGFKIRTPQAEFVDLGTAFGLQVGSGGGTGSGGTGSGGTGSGGTGSGGTGSGGTGSGGTGSGGNSEGQEEDGGSKLHVFKGEVELHQGGISRRILSGTGVAIATSGKLREFASNEAGFPSLAEMTAQSTVSNSQREQAWQSATGEFRHSPGLFLYFAVMGQASTERTLLNEAPKNGRAGDASIVGARWGDGRWPGKPSLEFRGVDDRVRFEVPGELQSLTLLASLRVGSINNPWNSLMMSDGWKPGSVHWQITNQGFLTLGVKPSEPNTSSDYNSPVIFTPQKLGQWVKLAVVLDRATRRVSHFVDGQLVSSEALRTNTPLRIGRAELGNWNVDSQNQRPVRSFNGSIDEFAAFDRALSPEEIRRFSAL